MTPSNVLAIICLLTVINVEPIKTSNSTKCHSLCVCLDPTTVLDCSNKNLTSAPNDLPSNTTSLLLKNNRIGFLSPDVFDYLPQLTEVDLSGNKINCDCSLSWVKNTSNNVQFVATCERPSVLRGRSLANLTVEDMCDIVTTPLAKTTVQITVSKTTVPRQTTTEEATTTAATAAVRTAARMKTTIATARTETSTATTTSATVTATTKITTATTITAATTTAAATTTKAAARTKQAVTTREMPLTTAEHQSTRATSQTTTTEHPTTLTESHSTTSKGAVVPSPTTLQTNKTSNLVPTDQQNMTYPNLTSIVNISSRTDLTPELLRSLVEMLESDASQRKYSDSTTTKNFLLISSNLMRKENHRTWSKVNENFPGVERLLKSINKAMRLQAVEMLKAATNSSQRFFANFSNLDAEIQIVEGEKMVGKEIQFPSSKSPEDDYIQISVSSFPAAGKNKVAVVGIKSSQLGELLPQRSLIDDFDSFNTGSGVLSASVLSLKEKISSSVRIKFKNKKYLGKHEEHAKCVFWKYEKSGKKNGDASISTKSGWSDEGCEVLSRNRSTTICHCDHMTDFAVLTQSIEEVVEPTIIMYIAGICLLLGAGIAFIRDIVVWRQTRRERLLVLIHECLAFILAAVVFLLGLFLDYHQAMCMVFAALLHWFVLAVFCWILTEFLQLYLAINFGWNRSSPRLKYFVIFGWVVPFVLVAITLAVTRQNEYGSTQWCWYSDSEIILLTYICPIALCILVSFIVIIKIVFVKAGVTDDSEKKDLSVVLALSGFLIPLVLCTFTTAALSADRPEETVFQYLFVVFCILLAIYILVYHCWLDREIMKLSVRKTVQRDRPKRDYYSTKETVMYSEDTSEGKSFSLIFPSRKSPTKKPYKNDKRSAKRSDSASPFDYDSTVPMYPAINDSSLKSFKSQVSTQQHTLETPPNTLSAITISRPNSQCIELTSLSDLDRRPDGAEQTDAGEPSEFYSARHSNPVGTERQRTSGCSTDCTNATTFGKEKPAPKPSDAPNNNSENKNRISGASSAGLSRTSRSSVSGASLTAAAEPEENVDDEAFEEQQPFIRRQTAESDRGPAISSDPPAKIPKRRKRGSRRRLDDEFHQDDDTDEPKIKTRQSSSTLPTTESSVKLKQYTSF